MSSLPVVLNAKAKHTATLIFLHGLKENGHKWAGILKTIQPDYLKIVCPTAPSIPVVIFEGKVKPSWFNVKSIATDETGFYPIDEDMEQIETSTKTLQNIIDSEAKELALGDKTRLMIGGFSGGGVIALNMLLKSKEKLGGCIALSCYIPDVTYKTVVPEVCRKIETPILHCHGADDMMLSFKRAKTTSKILSSIVQQYDFQLVPDMGHESSQEEMRIIQKFLVNQLPPKSTI